MTGAAAALAASPAADSGSEFPGVLAGVLLQGPAARLAAMLDRAFLAGAGWDPGSRMLSLPAGHPLLGRVVCRAGGCDATAHALGALEQADSLQRGMLVPRADLTLIWWGGCRRDGPLSWREFLAVHVEDFPQGSREPLRLLRLLRCRLSLPRRSSLPLQGCDRRALAAGTRPAVPPGWR